MGPIESSPMMPVVASQANLPTHIFDNVGRGRGKGGFNGKVKGYVCSNSNLERIILISNVFSIYFFSILFVTFRNSFSEKFNNFRWYISGNLRISLRDFDFSAKITEIPGLIFSAKTAEIPGLFNWTLCFLDKHYKKKSKYEDERNFTNAKLTKFSWIF